jgi:hypothetical protein
VALVLLAARAVVSRQGCALEDDTEDAVPRVYKRVGVLERILTRCTVEHVPGVREDLGPCWLSTFRSNSNGYVNVKLGGGERRDAAAHRVVYEALVGPIADGLQLDHLCRVRHCFCPEHLDQVTGRENTLRGNTITARCAAATHCPQGHEYTEVNTYRRPDHRRRDCKACKRAWSRERYYRRKMIA